MKKIKILDENIINKIAAGEVVERPSSVVKELIENSIDSGASSITVEIKEGGLSYIRISDNGCGISKEDAENAFLRHATSKIKNMEDLIKVMTLGFRGEALSSIASVSESELITKTREQSKGFRILISGGKFIENKEIGCPDGTTIVVRNLFFNVPARRKFLKKSSVEGSYISELIFKFAIGNPNISFKFINNGTNILNTNGNGDLQTCILQVYGKEISKNIVFIEENSNFIKINGFIGKPETARGNRKYENIFLNGRYIKSDLISDAVEEAYKTKLPSGKFPLFILNFFIQPEKIDVNVHPTKLEVRFSEEAKIFDFIYQSVLNFLNKEILIPKENWTTKKDKKNINEFSDVLTKKEDSQQMVLNDSLKNEIYVKEKAVSYLLEDEIYHKKPMKENTVNKIYNNRKNNYFAEKKDIQVFENAKIDLLDKKNNIFDNCKIIGQIFNTYWIIENNNSMFIIDQHAAHERILFEEINLRLKSGKISSQKLLTPIITSLSPNEMEVLKENLNIFDDFGFEIEEFEKNTIAIKSLPYIFDEPENFNFFNEIIDILLELNSTNNISIYDLKLLKISTIACKAAVKGNNKLSLEEAKRLIEKFIETENSFTCPHGRPTIIEMEKSELEKKFKRIQ